MLESLQSFTKVCLGLYWCRTTVLLTGRVGDHPNWSKTHGYFLQMGGFMLFDFEGEKSRKIQVGVLSPERLDKLFDKRLIKFPTITEEEINDRSKGDALSKTLVLGQTSWFIVQCISRWAEGLVTTELELATLAFAALNGFMYFFWWNKPLDVRTTVPVYLLSTPLPKPGLFHHHTSQPILTRLFSPICIEPKLPKTVSKSPLEQHPKWLWKLAKYFGASFVIPNYIYNK